MKRRALISAGCASAMGTLAWLWMRGADDEHDRHTIIESVFTASTLPVLTLQHLRLIRKLRVVWIPVESGAPGIHPFKPLYGPLPAIETAMQLLQTTDTKLAMLMLAQTCLLIPEFVASTSLEPGQYALPEGFEQAFHSDTQRQIFQFLPEHQLLLHSALWQEISGENIQSVLADDSAGQPLWPMPYIDGKRPYGDRSYYQIDMAERLRKPDTLDALGSHIRSPQQDAMLHHLHRQTQAALQVLLMHGSYSLSMHS